jgi:hypothetical protein
MSIHPMLNSDILNERQEAEVRKCQYPLRACCGAPRNGTLQQARQLGRIPEVCSRVGLTDSLEIGVQCSVDVINDAD